MSSFSLTSFMDNGVQFIFDLTWSCKFHSTRARMGCWYDSLYKDNRHATWPSNSGNSSASFVIKYCRKVIVFTNPASVHNLINCFSFERFCTLSLWFYKRLPCACTFVWSGLGMFNKSTDSTIDSDGSITAQVFSELVNEERILHTNLRLPRRYWAEWQKQ